MKTLPDTHHLQKRGDLYTYYRRVPTHLVPVLGRRFVKKALGVSTLAEAKKLRALQEVKTNALFEAAEKGLAGKGAGTSAQPVSLPVLTEHVRELVERLDRRSAERFAADPPKDGEQLDEMRQEADGIIATLMNPASPERHERVDRMASGILDNASAELNGDLASQFAEVVRRGLIELNRRKLDRYRDDHSRPFHDTVFDPARLPTATFGELCDLFVSQQTASYEANKVSEKRADSVRSKIATLREIVGDTRSVREIDDDVVNHVRVTIAKVPTSRVLAYPKLSLLEAIEQGAKDGRATLNPKTQGASLDLLRLVLALAVKKKFLASNPAQDVKPLVKDLVKAGNKRRPFTQDQIAKFFSSDFYRACAPDAPTPYAKPDRSWRFWLPLIMAFSGARPNEICALTAGDFDRTKTGTPFFTVTDDGEGKSIKTETSRRRVPIHPELIQIGLLNFVEERRTADGDTARLFPQLSPNQYGSLVWYPSRRFNEVWLPKEMGLEPRQTLYSFRHSVRDALRRINAGPDTLLHICGWAPAGKAASDDYGDLGDPDHHAEAIAGIAYAGVELAFLHQK